MTPPIRRPLKVTPVSRRSTRPVRLAALLAVPVLLLGACGDDDGSTTTGGEGLSAVTISGDVGEEPELTWDAQIDVDELESETLVTGDGAALEEGDQVLTRLLIAGGFDKLTAYSTFGKDAAPDSLTVGGDLSPALSEALEGQTVGSRVAVAAPPEDAFGETGNAQLGIGNKDSVLFVVDILDVLPDEPSGTDQEPAAWAPAVEGEGDPTGLDFTGTPEPNDKLRLTTLVEGDGPPVEKGQTVYVNYLGQVYGAKKPFDASYEREAFSFTVGAGDVVKGWDTLLEGVPVGSRVLIAVPPDQGYGEAGNPDAGIKGTDTLYFVIDVLAAV